MAKNVIIIGGGIIGLSCAYFLQKSGHHVTVIDQSKMDGGASYVNAGYMSPSHLVPLAAPGVMRQGIKWMFNSKSPLYIKPRLDTDFLKWSLAFNRSCTQKHVNSAVPVMKEIAVLGRDLYHQIKQEEGFSFHLEKKGLLMLCQTEATLHHEDELVQIAIKEGLSARTISALDVKKMMPDATLDVVGASYFECDYHSTPGEFMKEMKAHLLSKGVVIRQEEKVIDLEVNNGKIISVKTDKEVLKADEVVMAAGSWTSTLSRKLNINLHLQAGKGYRIQTTKETGITYPSILAEAKVAITPMNGFTRFAGTMEIAGINHTINKARVDSIADGVNKYFPEVHITAEERAGAACGLRPVSADGMPYIGKSSKCKNLTIATGHAMMGWTLGPSTGKLVQEIVDEVTPCMDMAMFHPDRTF
ncbi:D-amino-acid dehydrogenase [Dokdonia sp. Hel_I_63]|uniref:NAD(P)/FAD-dependent oxidoreductase n=1 Tax=Dokdonia sp. Hel_I_63 TaxID=1249996 RepID=UPI00119C4523|nr:FAD-dependent oxidoreductase [Dokdonia sp. Hel_I_63]TVZ21908.1 D-amino-acid dehydrogenase [Dokdonia sp. Hel_I_63]